MLDWKYNGTFYECITQGMFVSIIFVYLVHNLDSFTVNIILVSVLTRQVMGKIIFHTNFTWQLF